MKDIEEWIEREFFGLGVAIRRIDDPPIPGEPFMSMNDAEELVRRAYSEARDELRDALAYGIGAAMNELSVRGLPLEWSRESGIGVMLRALGCEDLRMTDAVAVVLSIPEWVEQNDCNDMVTRGKDVVGVTR